MQSGQSLPPARKRSRVILCRDPGQIITIRRQVRQRCCIAVVRVKREQFLHQHRTRPAIHQDVMAGQHQSVLLRTQPDQREAQQRWCRNIEPLGAILQQNFAQALLAHRRVQL